MTAEGELFVDEELRDIIEEQIKGGMWGFLKGKNWYIDASKFSRFYALGDMPNTVEVPIKDSKTDKIIAFVKAKNKISIEPAMTISGTAAEGEWIPSSVIIKSKKNLEKVI